jgi:hypothetical protein
MTPTEQAAYERGRADERADVVAWLRGCRTVAFDLAINLSWWRWRLISANLIAAAACGNLLRRIELREHMKGTDNG